MSTGKDQPTCMLCGASDPEPKFRVVRRDLGFATYDIFKCPRCDLLFAIGPTTSDLISSIYSGAFYESSQQTAPHEEDGSLRPDAVHWPIVANSRARVQWLLDLGAKGRLLDVGAGRGYFVHSASEHFDASGIELQEVAARFARKFGADVRQTDLMTAQLPPGSFDVVTLWDVFAGFPRPTVAMDALMRLLRPGGILVLTVPDASARIARVLGRHWPLLIPPGNLGYYSPRAIATLMARPDVREYRISHEGKWVSVRFLARKLLQMSNLHDWAQRGIPLPATWKISINTGDILTVVARKQ